jgi:hypothetical protein
LNESQDLFVSWHGPADHGGLNYGGMGIQHSFHVDGINVETGADD